MATPTAIKSVTVTLRAGVSDATLPNNQKMRYGFDYVISLADWAKISNGARDAVVAAPTFNTNPYIVPGYTATNAVTDRTAVSYLLDLSTINNKTTIALVNSDAQAPRTFALGDVVQGFNGDAFKLVLVDAGSSAVSAGTPVVWGGDTTTLALQRAFKAATTVTSDISDVTDDAASLEFAGVSIGTITAGNYGWIQVEGQPMAAVVETNVAAGDTLQVSENSDGKFTSFTNEVQTLVLTSFDAGDTIKLTHAAVEGSAITASASAGVTLADFQAKADTLFATTITGYVAGACVVTQTTLNVEYVFTFSGASVKGTDISAITATSGTGGSSGVFTETAKGNGTSSGVSVGTALTSADTGTANVELRSTLFANRHRKTAKLFLDKN